MYDKRAPQFISLLGKRSNHRRGLPYQRNVKQNVFKQYEYMAIAHVIVLIFAASVDSKFY